MLENFLYESGERTSECAFTNLFMWQGPYHIFWTVAHGFLLLGVNRKEVDFYVQPFGGKDEDLPALFQELKELHKDKPIHMHGIYESGKERLSKLFPELVFEENRDDWDYVYLREKLATLGGRKLHGQKNHYNSFVKNYPYFQYEAITEANIEEVKAFAFAWCDQRQAEDPTIVEEKHAIGQALGNFKKLGLRGGIIRLDDEIAAISYGSKINDDTAVIHVEKALPGIRGLNIAMTKEFAAHAWDDVVYMNREEDMGLEGLRKAKEDLKPEMLLKKYSTVF